MRVSIIGKNLEITDKLREQISKQVNKLDKFLRDDAEVQVKLSQENALRNRAEITIEFGRHILRAEETNDDMYACIDKVSDKIVRQIRRHRTKIEKRLRTGAFEPEPIEAEDTEEETAALVRVKKFSVKPMAVEDAIAQMDMLGHSFFLFLNEETNTACVVYRREDGNYGLLEPENI